MNKKQNRADLNIYLVKPDIDNPSLIIKKIDSLKSFQINIAGNNIGTLFIKTAYSTPPKWSIFFNGAVSPVEFGSNSSTGAVFFIPIGNRVFLLTFGQGRHLVNTEYLEMDFGLTVALNCLDSNSLRSIDKSSFESYPKQSREQSGKATELQYFGIDIARDLLRAITGKPKSKGYGERISGMVGLKLSIEIDLSSLKTLLSNLLTSFEDTSYKEGPFSWVDHIAQIKDIDVIETLDNELISKINNKDIDKIWLSVPEIIDWDVVIGFKYGKGYHSPRVYDIRVPDFVKTLDGQLVNKDLLMRKRIYCVDANDLIILERPAYYFIYAEITVDAKTCLLNNGKWYSINQHYVQQVTEFYSQIKIYQKKLPVYEDDTEGEYNERVASSYPIEFALLDKKNVYSPGAASPVEICDLFRQNKEFIHVKRYGGSSVLSHLFNQGLVSGELFQMEAEFRKITNEKLPPQHKLLDWANRPFPREYKIIYAIISESDDDLSIPFFSKISLRHCISRLQLIGYDVEIAKISVSPETRLKKVYPPKKIKS